MSNAQSKAARQRFQREALQFCPTCDGTGIVKSEVFKARARKGGVNSYLKSLQAGHLSMTERGRMGGRPKEPTLADLEVLDRGADPPSL